MGRPIDRGTRATPAATLGSSFNNLIVLIWTEGTVAQNVTLDGALQLEAGTVATQRELRCEADELRDCLPYFYQTLTEVLGTDATSVTSRVTIKLSPQMWKAPTVTLGAGSAGSADQIGPDLVTFGRTSGPATVKAGTTFDAEL